MQKIKYFNTELDSPIRLLSVYMYPSTIFSIICPARCTEKMTISSINFISDHSILKCDEHFHHIRFALSNKNLCDDNFSAILIQHYHHTDSAPRAICATADPLTPKFPWWTFSFIQELKFTLLMLHHISNKSLQIHFNYIFNILHFFKCFYFSIQL